MRRIASAFAIGMIAVMLLPLAPRPGAAAEGVRQGWWTTGAAGGVLPGTVLGPDVPSDGLLVQGGASDSSPAAFAALAVPVAAKEPRTLVVHATTSSLSVSGSTIKACRLTSATFDPAQGGDISEAPDYDCTDPITASAGADGITYAFDVRRLVLDGVVAVALVPGTSTTRVVLAKPGDDVLLYAQPEATAPVASRERPSTPSPATAVRRNPLVQNRSESVATPAARPAADSFARTAPVVPAAAVLGAAALPDANPAAVLLVALVLAVAGTFWLRAGRSVPG